MYPQYILRFSDGSGIGLYEIFFAVGIVAALVLVRVLADRRKIPAKLQNLLLIDAVAACVVGYFAAVLFQGVYDWFETGVFKLDSTTGATFYGGLIGGAGAFCAIYFGFGHLLFKEGREHIRYLAAVANIAAVCIPAAHAFGRLGCLSAGCCSGKPTDAWFGIYMHTADYGYAKVVPLQLFEALFLFALAGFLFARNWQRKGMCMPAYLIGYGVWRFVIEFFRGDDRGATFISFFSPSQLTAVLLVLAGIGMTAAYFWMLKKRGKAYFKGRAGFAKYAEEPAGAEPAEESGENAQAAPPAKESGEEK